MSYEPTIISHDTGNEMTLIDKHEIAELRDSLHRNTTLLVAREKEIDDLTEHLKSFDELRRSRNKVDDECTRLAIENSKLRRDWGQAMSDQTKLIPCPFCGNEYVEIKGRHCPWAQCHRCDAAGPTKSDTDDTIAACNRRATKQAEGVGGTVETVIIAGQVRPIVVVNAHGWAGKKVRVTLAE